jgi:hypothetical protein
MLKERVRSVYFIVLAVPSDDGQYMPNHVKTKLLLTHIKLVTLGGLVVLTYVLRGVMFSCLVFRALKDADKAVMFAPQNPKGYYRRGEALRGLKVNLSCQLLGCLLQTCWCRDS